MQQALDQLRQANDEMRRATAQSQMNPDEARRAADKLREAQRLLGGIQGQQSSQRLETMVREGDRLANEAKDQQERARQAFGRGAQGQSEGARYQQLNQLSGDRKRMGDDLASLERQMQDGVKNLANGQRPAASKLRDALGEAQQSDLHANPAQLRLDSPGH